MDPDESTWTPPTHHLHSNSHRRHHSITHEVDERQMDEFRCLLRDGKVHAWLHGDRGLPQFGVLKLHEDKVTLSWHERPGRWKRWFDQWSLQGAWGRRQQATTVSLSDVRSIRDGRQTTNFIRTLKYIDPEDVPENDDHCLSLCAPSDVTSLAGVGGSSAVDTVQLISSGSGQAEWTLDLEFEDVDTRNLARAFFVHEANLSGAIDLCEPGDIPLPHGLSVLCFQLYTHPTFELLVLAVVAATMLFIALKPFVLDEDEQQLVTTKPTVAANLSPLELALLLLLSIEQIAKLIALEGLWPVARAPWNAFDLAVVGVSWLAMGPAGAFSGFDMLPLRLFRCMRVFKSWHGFREMLGTFVASLPLAGQALLCYCYYLFIFAILGMYLFNDAMSHRCAVDMGAGEYVAAFPTRFCSVNDGLIASTTSVTACNAPQECVTMLPPNNGNTGFHSFQASFLTVFLITLRAGFGSSFDGAQQGSSYLAILFFIALVVFVSYMTLSIFVGIVRGSYIAITIVGAAHQHNRNQKRTLYLAKHRPQFPSGTDRFPDVAKLVVVKWRLAYQRMKEAVLRSPLFQSRDDPDDSFLAQFRLRQHRLFFLLEPNSDAMDRITAVCESQLFEHFMNWIVFGNAILFSLEYHGMSADYAARLHAIETVLILVYAVEFVLVCITAGGLVNYLRNPWNRLDFFILVAAATEYVSMAVSLVYYTDTYTRVIFALRLFRLVRPFRAVRNTNELLQVLDAILASVPGFLSLTCFFLLLSSMFAVIGMNLFGGKFPTTMRSHFNTFGDAMLTLFKISCGGNVWQIFYASLDATQSFPLTVAFYLTFFVATVYLALNFMLVVLLRNFAMKEDERKRTLSDLFQERMVVMQRVHHFDEYTFVREFSDLYQNDTMYLSLSGSAAKRAKMKTSATEELKLRLLKVLPISDFLRFENHSKSVASGRRVGPDGLSGAGGGKYKRLSDGPASPDESPPPSTTLAVESRPGSPSIESDSVDRPLIDSISRFRGGKHGLCSYLRCFVGGKWLTSDVSLFLFPPNSPVRLRCKRLEKETDKYIFAVIVVRTVLLTVQSPLYSSLIQEFTTLSDVVFATVMVFEFTIKVISRGFIFTPRSYLSNTWNQINMVVMMACSLLLLLPHSSMLMVFRLSRAFGPVRVFYRVKTFRVISEALKQSAKQLLCCVLLAAFMFYAFATFGMQLFAGKFSFCNDASVHTRAECDGFFTPGKAAGAGLLMPRVWGNLAGLHFDNIGGAMGSVLVLVSKKGWLPVLNLAMDIVDSDHQPVQNASAYFAVFFVAFIFLSRFFMLKVFAGIIMNNFRCYNGTLLLTNAQLVWLRAKQQLLALRPKYPLPRNRLLQKAQKYAQARHFRVFSSGAVLLHTFLLAWYRSDRGGGQVWWCHYVFAALYAFDAAASVASMGWKDFLMKGFTWRTANSVTAFLMLVGPLLSDSPVLLVLFLTRAFDLKHLSLALERFSALRSLVETLHASVRLALKVTLLLGYALFVFAIVGVQLFSVTRWGHGLDGNTAFTTFPRAFASLVKFAAGEDWYDTYQASSVAAPKCVALALTTGLGGDYPSDCGSALLAALYYNVFYILVSLILQNLYVATIVDTYVSTAAVAHGGAAELLGFDANHLRQFQHVWSEFDANALGYVHPKHLLALLSRLEPPLGLGSRRQMLARLVTPDTPQAQLHALAQAVHQHRREVFHDVEARLAELTVRALVTGAGHHDAAPAPGSELVLCPVTMLRFADLLLVLAARVVPLESLTVQEKVDELAVRGYSFRHRQAVRIQAAFRAYRVRRRQRWIIRSSNSPRARRAASQASQTAQDAFSSYTDVKRASNGVEKVSVAMIIATDIPINTDRTSSAGNGVKTPINSTNEPAPVTVQVEDSNTTAVKAGRARPPTQVSHEAQENGAHAVAVPSVPTLPPIPRAAATSSEKLMLLFEGRV